MSSAQGSSFLSPVLAEACEAVCPLDPALFARARERLDSLTKPRGSLGRLEDAAARLFAIQGQRPLVAGPARMITIAADHGVVAEGVASSPQAVTRLMVENFLKGGAGINALCAAAGAELRVVDAGVAAPAFAPHPLLISAKIAPGTDNLAKGPAMTREQCLAALELGLRLAEDAYRDGIKLVGTGEMGIGNTTPSSALFCAYLGFSPEDMTGMGAGLSKNGLKHKTQVIAKALELHAPVIRSADALDILAALGGLEIAALAGLIIGSAAKGLAVVVDGFISTAAFAAAERLAPVVREYCFFAHGSAEAGHKRALARLGLEPLLDLGLRLGEGTGAALAFNLLAGAVRVFNDMATFDSAGITV
ncbi:nicotinate-nucleotide--dimethylbenzimidazole phosphoribosyltransferase [Desulfovibrio sp. OttesenSCG-928-M16]|nr:nicotinate-nucleotide--dimethylbenzimidazole phosphoribosyltransferase [Desulfovibrio sp. OttesenSCG-928-M16]